MSGDLVPTVSGHLTADEVLYVLAGCRTVDLARLSLLVVTGAHTPAADEPRPWPYTPGEIVVVDRGRDGTSEIVSGRDAEAWYTGAVYMTKSLREAVALSALVRAGAGRGMYEWDGRVWFRPPDQSAAMHCWNSLGDESGAFVGDTDGENTHGRDITYPGKYTWPSTDGKAS